MVGSSPSTLSAGTLGVLEVDEGEEGMQVEAVLGKVV